MSGRQIRWRSVGRVAAILAAAIAGIASLPALLGGDAPPPVPPDVGLAQAPIPTSPAPMAPPQSAHPPAMRKPPKPRHRAAHKLSGRQPERPQHRHASPNTETVPPPAYLPVPSYSPPPQPDEFRFER